MMSRQNMFSISQVRSPEALQAISEYGVILDTLLMMLESGNLARMLGVTYNDDHLHELLCSGYGLKAQELC